MTIKLFFTLKLLLYNISALVWIVMINKWQNSDAWQFESLQSISSNPQTCKARSSCPRARWAEALLNNVRDVGSLISESFARAPCQSLASTACTASSHNRSNSV